MTCIGSATRTAALLGLVVVVCAPLGAGQSEEDTTTYVPSADVPIQMYEFLDAWLVYGSMTEAMSHFDGSKPSVSLAPRSVRNAPKVKEFFFNGRRPEVRNLSSTERAAYWSVLNEIWPRPDTHHLDGVGLWHVLNPVHQELAADFAAELGTRVLSTEREPFLVFEADSKIVLHSFDPGFGDIELLLQDDRPTLGMLADFAHTANPEGSVFVSFWGEKPRGVWRIQALGAIRP